jgi:hypothetical protein
MLSVTVACEYRDRRLGKLPEKHIWTLRPYVPTHTASVKVEVEVTFRLTVSQYVLVSSTLVGLATRYYFLSECCCLKFAVLYLLGALSDERMGLQFAVQSLNSMSRSEPVTIIYCLIWDSPNLEGQVPVLISPRSIYSQSCNDTRAAVAQSV